MSADDFGVPSDDTTYGLVMPFVVVTSVGAPYPDEAFVAGVRYGMIDAELQKRPASFATSAEPELVPQLDLLAMHHGYTLTAEPWDEHPDDWSLVEFVATDPTAEPPKPKAEDPHG